MVENKTYKIDLKAIVGDCHRESFILDDAYFADSEKIETDGGYVEATVDITKTAGVFDVQIELKGKIKTICDRCLDELICPVDTSAHLMVKLGEEYEEESEDIITIPEKEAILDLSWLLYEFVELSLPMKKVHPESECNQDMIDKLYDFGEEDASKDPRWAELSKLKDKLS